MALCQAAEVVHLTASAVSQQVQALEQELGIALFERSSRPPRMTSQGLQVVEMARDILRLEENTKASLRGDTIAGTLMLGSVRTSGLSLLPRTISQMRFEYPAVKVNLRVGLSSLLIADVAGGGLTRPSVAGTHRFSAGITDCP